MSDESMEMAARQAELTIKPSINTLAQGSMFWQPSYLERSVWLEHLPFLFWLVESMQPRQVVTLGMQRGVAHFALCQAVSRLGLDARCHAVQPKAGQGENPTLDAALEYNERVYGAFADVVDATPVKAASQFDDGSVDLLLLNAESDEVELDYLFERWRSKLSSCSVVLIPSVARRDPGYEAFRDFDALMSRYPGFAFQHGGGLGLVMVGEQPSGMLKNLLGSEESPTAQQVVRDVFARLGRTCLDSFNAREQKARADELNASLEEQQRQLGELTASYEQSHEALQARERELGDVKQRLDRQVEHHAHERGQLAERVSLLQEFRDDMKGEMVALRARLEEQQRRQTESAQQASRLLEENHANVERIQRFEQELKERSGEVERLSGELEKTTQALGERKQRLATLRQQLEEREAEHTKAETRNAELAEQLTERDASLDAARQRVEDLERQLAERDQAREAQEARVRELEQDNERLNREASEASRREEAVQEKCQGLEQRLQEQTSTLEAKQKEVDERFEELGKLTRMLEESEQTRERLEKDAREAEQRGEKQQTRIQELERDNERLTREVSESSPREAALEEKCGELEARLQEQTSALEGKQKEVDDRFEELGKLTRMLNEAKKERDELRKSHDEQSASIDERFQELATLTKMLEENEQAREQLEKDARQAEQQTASRDEQLKESEAKRREAQAEVERQAREIRQLIASLEAYRRPRLDVDPLDFRNELYSKKRKSRKDKAQIERHRQVIASSPLFDAEWYLAQYPDVASNQNLARDPARHYLLFGGYEGRNPGPGFDSSFYLANNPDVLYRGMNPLLHYMKFGEAEQRQVVPQ